MWQIELPALTERLSFFLSFLEELGVGLPFAASLRRLFVLWRRGKQSPRRAEGALLKLAILDVCGAAECGDGSL